MRILLAEDEPPLNKVIKTALEKVGHYQVDSVFNGKDAVALERKNAYDVIILDIMMPVMDGITALKKIRANGDRTYIMMLTAKAEVDDKVTGLEAGADDYLTKPFSLKELIARLQSRERRTDHYANGDIKFGDLTLKVDDEELEAHNSISLASKETELLRYLLINKGKKISTEELFNHVWKNDDNDKPEVVWVYISYLRQKLLSVRSHVKIEGQKGGSFKIIK